MKKESNVIRMFVSDELNKKLIEEFGQGQTSDGLKQKLYKDFGVKQPLPPTAEQKKAMSEISMLDDLIRRGIMTAEAAYPAKKQIVQKYDLDVEGFEDDEDTENKDTEKSENKVSENSKKSQSESKTDPVGQKVETTQSGQASKTPARATQSKAGQKR